MEHFAQTNVFVRIRTIFAHLIIGCTIRYPKIDNLHYFKLCKIVADFITFAAYTYGNDENNRT